MPSRNYIADCRQSKGWVIYKTFKVIASSKEEDLNKKYISNRIKYPQHDLKQDEAIRQLHLGVDDNVLTLNGQVFYYGQVSFEKSDHDWYCYKCHDVGNVFKCLTCWRVFHISCANFTGDQCTSCKRLQIPQNSVRGEILSVEQINNIIKKILNRLNEDAKHINTLSVFEGNFYNSVPIAEIKKLVYNSEKNFNIIENKVKNQAYNTLNEFLVDCEDVNHNLMIIYGPKGRISKLVEKMLETSLREVEFASECLNCFKNFYERSTDKSWFCQSCSPPHDIVFAKFRGFPLWPCKVVAENEKEKTCQVWFFGGNYTRSQVPNSCIYSIEDSIKALSSEIQPNKGSKMYQKAIIEYDTYMEKTNQCENKIGSIILNKTLNRESSLMQIEEPHVAPPPTNFLLAMGETLNGSVLNVSQVSVSNGNSKSLDGTSNMSFTFNGDSMNNSISNSDIDLQASIIKSEKIERTVGIQSSIIFSDKAKNGKKSANKNIVDLEIKEENQRLKRKLKEAEDKVLELKQNLKECYTKEYVDNLNVEYKQMLLNAKKKTWCRVCDSEAFYYCCWNTFYCSLECQNKHWWSDHKNQCFRKKHKKSINGC